ncbi:hypothetical protein BGZ95_005005, partial [Linnemannia exigua]
SPNETESPPPFRERIGGLAWIAFTTFGVVTISEPITAHLTASIFIYRDAYFGVCSNDSAANNNI